METMACSVEIQKYRNSSHEVLSSLEVTPSGIISVVKAYNNQYRVCLYIAVYACTYMYVRII